HRRHPSPFASAFTSSAPRPPRSTLFPYTTLFRSSRAGRRCSAPPSAGSLPTPDRPSVSLVRGSSARRPPGSSPDGGGPTSHERVDRKSTRLNSSHVKISYAVFCLKKKK